MGTDIASAAAQGLSTSAPPRICPHNATKLFLPQAAYDIMENYFLHVYMHFAHLRRREKRFSEGCRPGPPSLDADPQRKGADMRMGGTTRKHSVVAKLDVLLEEEPSPTPEVAAIWADVLAQGVFAEDILTYALLRQVKRHVGEGDMASSPGSLRSSTSELVGSLKQSPSQPPKAPPQLPSTSSSACPETIPSSGDASRLGPGSPLVCFLSDEGHELVQRLRHALSAPASPHPKTFSELSTWLRRGSVSVTAS
ncbi:hypothetical protein V8D89_009916 [Ganoderma adspersum]